MIINDQSYIDRILLGESHAFGKLVDKYKDMVFTLCLRMTGNREEAEEVAQDTFVKAFNSLKKFKGDSKFSTWLYRIAYNTSLDRIKKLKRHQKIRSIDDQDHYDIATIEKGYEQLDRQARAEAVKSCLQSLPGDGGFLLTLHYYEDLSLQEIAEITGNSLSNVKVKMFRCRKKLMKLIQQQVEPEFLEGYENKIRPAIR